MFDVKLKNMFTQKNYKSYIKYKKYNAYLLLMALVIINKIRNYKKKKYVFLANVLESFFYSSKFIESIAWIQTYNWILKLIYFSIYVFNFFIGDFNGLMYT